VNAVSAVSVDINKSGPVDDLPGFSEGLFFVQDAAAACSVLAAGPERGSHILDMCAAPGGKSLLCASVMRNEGEIVSCDLHAKKLRLIRENADRLGFDCIQTRAMDASEPDEEYFSAFDLVIADVPCSGMGVIRKKPEIRYKDPESLKNLPSVQLRILTGAAKCVRPGGKLLYSTCTVFHEENRDVIDAFLDNTGEFSVLESRTIWPQDNGTDGFYYCLLKRNDHDR
jgi:16S rRNA (cytosine967-C5)-methyltransferase